MVVRNYKNIISHLVAILLKDVIQERQKLEFHTRNSVIVVAAGTHFFHGRIQRSAFPEGRLSWRSICNGHKSHQQTHLNKYHCYTWMVQLNMIPKRKRMVLLFTPFGSGRNSQIVFHLTYLGCDRKFKFQSHCSFSITISEY